jgi:hypothetical protein
MFKKSHVQELACFTHTRLVTCTFCTVTLCSGTKGSALLLYASIQCLIDWSLSPYHQNVGLHSEIMTRLKMYHKKYIRENFKDSLYYFTNCFLRGLQPIAA